MTNLESALSVYAEFIKQDYVNWWSANGTRELSPTQRDMIDDFLIEFESGSVYIKVVQSSRNGQRSVHSFIVNKAGKKYPIGTILKAASWKGPTLNFARGNIVNGDFKNVRWSGV